MYKNYTREIIEGSDIGKICLNEENYMKVVEMYGINFRDIFRKTALIWAYIIENVEIVRLLLKIENINVNLQDNDGETALMWACRNINNTWETTALILQTRKMKNFEIVKSLLEVENIDVNLRDNNGRTALMFACRNENVEIFKLLLKVKNIDVNVQDEYGWTAFTLAREYGNHEIIELLEYFNKTH